jgi:hypothetical protein
LIERGESDTREFKREIPLDRNNTFLKTVAGKRVLALFVEEGNLPPYGLDAAKPRFYVRRGATSFPVNQTEVRAFAKKFDSSSDNYWFKPESLVKSRIYRNSLSPHRFDNNNRN